MSNFDKAESRKAFCPSCQRETRVDTQFEKTEHWHEEDIEGIFEYFVFQCRGCEFIFMCRASSNSEDVANFVNDFGQYEAVYPWKLEYLPSQPRHKFNELSPLPLALISPQINIILRETYRAAREGMFILAAGGIRTTFDLTAEYLNINSDLSFSRKLDELRQAERIGGHEKDVLLTLVDAGSAALHRGWMPNAEQIGILIDTINSFIEAQVIRPQAIKQLGSAIPGKGA